MTFRLYYSGEFERFSRRIEKELSDLPTLGVAKLANIIVNQKLHTSRESGRGIYRGPGGRFIIGDIDTIYTTAQNVARAVLELSPQVEFVEIYPKTKRVLAFDWLDAPPPVRAAFAKTFPRVFFAHVRVPVRIQSPDFKEISRDAFTSDEFRGWLEDMIRRALIR